MTSSFLRDLRAGRTLGEAPVSRWLSRRYSVRPATAEGQRRGIDLVADTFHIEVKVSRSPRDSFFLETNGGQIGAGGWLFTSEADLFALVDASSRFVILVRPEALRREAGRFIEAYGQALGPAPEKGRARGRGVFVPLWELEKLGRLAWLSAPAPALEEVP
jgi:hypothetical protein